jgi:hypothetical protein
VGSVTEWFSVQQSLFQGSLYILDDDFQHFVEDDDGYTVGWGNMKMEDHIMFRRLLEKSLFGDDV